MLNLKLSVVWDRKSISQFQQMTLNQCIDSLWELYLCVLFSYTTFHEVSFAFNDKHFPSWEFFLLNDMVLCGKGFYFFILENDFSLFLIWIFLNK